MCRCGMWFAQVACIAHVHFAGSVLSPRDKYKWDGLQPQALWAPTSLLSAVLPWWCGPLCTCSQFECGWGCSERPHYCPDVRVNQTTTVPTSATPHSQQQWEHRFVLPCEASSWPCTTGPQFRVLLMAEWSVWPFPQWEEFRSRLLRNSSSQVIFINATSSPGTSPTPTAAAAAATSSTVIVRWWRQCAPDSALVSGCRPANQWLWLSHLLHFTHHQTSSIQQPPWAPGPPRAREGKEVPGLFQAAMDQHRPARTVSSRRGWQSLPTFR